MSGRSDGVAESRHLQGWHSMLKRRDDAMKLLKLVALRTRHT